MSTAWAPMAAPAAKATTLTLAPGNKPLRRPLAQRGFTLIELLVVVALIAIATATISLSLRDPAAAQLEREAERLAALLETARAEARVAGVPVSWAPLPAEADGAQFRFQGLPPRVQLPNRWLGEPPGVDMAGAKQLRLGPEPMVGAQRVTLHMGSQRIAIVTDGLGPFEVSHDEEGG
ncbi:prepilin-type N-terminal cleavage/methylation domain-containing protein [Paucibacter sp. APW11]|uniref:Prepilin-type N-terminal cleavage/methylation domain-containing protein n=1 Tax=Roseateles aquae TaxID=3077235 RepID=A0ABU3PHW9_9BURK|nr:prepilin-type N-terminal cleavage/methylation domain-containing protein [Paucibacter sp. APW11]MDT9002169.1 prepilin-type N-terminal cleavage/methylation domain-containing protein [Paucibacter sp. APW11]